jgi:hypothetical protein
MSFLARKYRRTFPRMHHVLTWSRPGAFAISFLLPILVYIFAYACNDVSGCPPPSLLHPSKFTLDALKREVGWPEDGLIGLFNWESVAASIGYLLVNAILYRILPAVEVEGTQLRSGGRLKYRFNSMCLMTAPEVFHCMLIFSFSSVLPHRHIGSACCRHCCPGCRVPRLDLH